MNEHVARVSLYADDEGVRTEVARIASLAGVVVDFARSRAAAQAAVLRLEQVRGNGVAVRASFHPSYAPYFVEGSVTVHLPQEAEDLLELMLAAGSTQRGSVIGVVGAQGGAGVSTTAMWLARSFAATYSVALIDLDPMSPGIDLLAHLRADPGMRWKDVAEEQGALVPGRLSAALPHLGDLCVLSADSRGGVRSDGDEGERAIAALSQARDVTVLDFPRHAANTEAEEHRWMAWCDALVVISRVGPLGGEQCRITHASLPERIPRVVVALGASGKVHAAAFAEDADVESIVPLRYMRGLNHDLSHGVRVGDRRRCRTSRDIRAIAQACERLLGSEFGVRS